MNQYLIISYRPSCSFDRGGNTYSRTSSEFGFEEKEDRESAVRALAHFLYLSKVEVYTKDKPFGDRESHVFVNGWGPGSYVDIFNDDEESIRHREYIAEAKAIEAEADKEADKLMLKKTMADFVKEAQEKAEEAERERLRDIEQINRLKNKHGIV